ncbi:MAG TPA: hypothetical protein DHW31_04225 [Bacteroides graminisolvens]|uniref:Uncharacterized protein n=1 Tax=Bacteroides graminisolvens TaxID=477666 RepID=A0A3D2SCK0_9BACE|nr:hypothetical protein [Bacteroides graminisolvens]
MINYVDSQKKTTGQLVLTSRSFICIVRKHKELFKKHNQLFEKHNELFEKGNPLYKQTTIYQKISYLLFDL